MLDHVVEGGMSLWNVNDLPRFALSTEDSSIPRFSTSWLEVNWF